VRFAYKFAENFIIVFPSVDDSIACVGVGERMKLEAASRPLANVFNATVRYRVAEREAVDLWHIVSRKTRLLAEEVGWKSRHSQLNTSKS
jgi:hypothetical protein